MSKSRPLSVTIIAWLFILAGGWSVWTMVSGFWQHQPTLNSGFLFIFLGQGLRDLRPVALSWAWVLIVLSWIFLVIAVICGLCGIGTMRIGQEAVAGGQRISSLLGLAFVYGALLAWMTRVLTRKEVKVLFQYHGQPEDSERKK
jgi:hypothetical protein